MIDCPFCQLLAHGLPAHCLYEDRRFFVLLDRASMGPGHCMVIPKRHVVTVYDLDESENLNVSFLKMNCWQMQTC
jgi:histidine triad (HIT) family protein